MLKVYDFEQNSCMKVKKLMTRDPQTCSPGDSLASAAAVMWSKDCGIVPIVEDGGAIAGVVTDRDICMAVSSRQKLAVEIPIGELMNGQPVSCGENDSIKKALRKMKKHQIKRIPVITKDGQLQGILSMADLLSCRKKSVRRKASKVLESISKPRSIVLKES